MIIGHSLSFTFISILISFSYFILISILILFVLSSPVHAIIPSDTLQAEIAHRINCWVWDMSGRRDFSHVFNIEVRKWEMKKKADFKMMAEQMAEGDHLFCFFALFCSFFLYVSMYFLLLFKAPITAIRCEA